MCESKLLRETDGEQIVPPISGAFLGANSDVVTAYQIEFGSYSDDLHASLRSRIFASERSLRSQKYDCRLNKNFESVNAILDHQKCEIVVAKKFRITIMRTPR